MELHAILRKRRTPLTVQFGWCGMQGGHQGQPTFIAPLQLLFHVPADSEAEAAASLIVQLTHQMPLQVRFPTLASCIDITQ